ncbi:MAG: hypothetical protein NUW21_00780, partial [Elusimicrobia bacterium]|nr:hypothetical protein [Elusimicrobiota bacterium]
ELKTLTEKAIATHLRPPPGAGVLSRSAQKVEAIGEKVDIHGTVRETSRKAWLADLFKKRGASDERAVEYASTVMGAYHTTSKGGRYFKELFPLTKFYTELASNLILGAGKEAVSGKRSLKGLSEGPWPKIAAMFAAKSIINRVGAGSTMTPAQRAEAGSGLVVYHNEEEDYYVVLETDTLDGLVWDALSMGSEAAQTRGKSLISRGSRPGDVTNRATLALKAPYMLGRDFPYDMRGLTSDEQSEEAARRGGIGLNNPILQFLGAPKGGRYGNLDPNQQQVAESFYAPARILRNVSSGDTDTIDKIAAISRIFGPNIRIIRGHDAERRQFSANKERALQRVIDSDSDPDAIDAYLDLGGTSADIRAARQIGEKNRIRNEEFSAPERREMQWMRSGRAPARSPPFLPSGPANPPF